MSTDSTVTEVFEDVEVDPDAILDACEADTPEAILEGGGEHDAVPDDEIDADDVTAADLFANLKETALELSGSDAPGAPGADATDADADASATGWELVGSVSETRISNDAFGVGEIDSVPAPASVSASDFESEADGGATSGFDWFES